MLSPPPAEEAEIAAAAARCPRSPLRRAGYLALDLLNANSTDCRSSLLARCLSTFRVAVDAACAIQLTPLAGGGAYVPAIWSTHAAATYARLQECPTSASAAVPTSSDPTEAEVKAAIQTALERHIYGDAYALAVSGVAWDTGTVLVTTAADTCQLKFGITSVRACLHACLGSLPSVPARRPARRACAS